MIIDVQRSIYKPVRRYYSAFASLIAVFVFSGLMHEWLVHACFKYHRLNIPEAAYYKPSNIVIGMNFYFFTWGFVPITIERALGRIPLMKKLWANIPRALKTLIVLMTTLPLSFSFVLPYLNGRLLLDAEGFGPTVFRME